MIFKQHMRLATCLAMLALFAVGPVSTAVHANGVATFQELLRDRLSALAGNESVEIDGAVLLSPEAVRSFYAERGGSPVWNAGDSFGVLSRSLLAAVRTAAGHGLEPRIYHESFIERTLRLPYDQHDDARRVDTELLFTDALLTYANDLLKGRARYADLRDSSVDAPEHIDASEAVYAAVAENEVRQLPDRFAPKPAAYQRLQDALSRLRDLEPANRPFDLPERSLNPGDTGGEVAALRRRLAYLGDLPEAENDNRGVFDETLAEAVKRFQSRHGLEVDGIVGRQTRPALETPISKRIAQVKLNLERWRWLPRDPGDRYLLVNIAGQELDVIENDRRTLHMRVIVGKPFQRTPSFASKIETVVLNPYWEVPYSIAVKEILPTLRSDPEYLARENMQVFKRLESGEPLDPATIDWTEVSARNFPYRFRQKPGPDNALGLVKFLLPNKYSVYLHDTPAKTLFARARRCFSHGCVRLEKPFELAELLLHDEPGWSSERMKKTLETEQNYRIRLTRPMPTYLAYWTAWVDNRGIMHFRDDVYGRDARLEAALDGADP